MTKKKLSVKPYPLGAHFEDGAIRFAFASGEEKCGFILYDKTTGKKLRKISFTEQEKIGNVFCKYVEDVEPESISYQFYEGDKIVADPYARGFDKVYDYGKQREESSLRAIIPRDDFDWENDVWPRLPYHACICYCMHVRGFTKHVSSGVACRGSFLGMTQKLQYLKDSGFTTIELQPSYEFLEIETKEKSRRDKAAEKINYWGYKKGFYYQPKQSYASGMDASREFKEMVKAFHKNNMEIVMQFYFPRAIPPCEIPEILRFWVLEYHVDGFHIKGEDLPADMIAGDPLLSDTKIWYDDFDTNRVSAVGKKSNYKNLASYSDEYMYVMRRFLKGDGDMLNGVLHQMRYLPEQTGRIHYLTNYYGFTLADLVSFDYKHNESNGEENRDGNNANYSWNCGEEGITRKKRVKELRLKQMKNAICMLLFSQSTPLIFMGDEFGNSQRGNNNPYCQDNATTWLNWNDLEKNKELYSFWKQLVTLRKEHPILRPDKEFRIMDYLSSGYPDLSYHGQNAWKPQLEGDSRHVGIMYCGKYANKMGVEDSFFYLAINMHWESRELAFPKIPKGLAWELVCQTSGGNEHKKFQPEQKNVPGIKIPPRSIAVFTSVRKGK